MKFTLTISIQPSGPFGVPEDNTTVVQGKPGSISGPTLHIASGKTVGYGTLSQYRPVDKAVNLSFEIGNCSIRLRDNYGFVEIQANSPDEAYRLAHQDLNRFLKHLTLSNGDLFTFKPLILKSEDSKLHPVPEYLQLSRFTAYNLVRLVDSIEDASRLSAFEDQKLSKAIEYYEQAILLFQHRNLIADIFSRHHGLIISSVFMNLWKAISVIVGDPNVDRDYQKRYRFLGFDQDFFKQKIEKVRELRNNYDVAHYSLDPQGIKEIETNFGDAHSIVKQVLQQYRTQLSTAS